MNLSHIGGNIQGNCRVKLNAIVIVTSKLVPKLDENMWLPVNRTVTGIRLVIHPRTKTDDRTKV